MVKKSKVFAFDDIYKVSKVYKICLVFCEKKNMICAIFFWKKDYKMCSKLFCLRPFTRFFLRILGLGLGPVFLKN